MNGVIDIPWSHLALFCSILLVPLLINFYYRLELAKDAVISLGRMVLQLILIGFYLEYLFQLESVWINLLWLAIMVVVGASAILSKAKLPKKMLLLPIIAAMCAGLLPVLALLCFALIQPTPWYGTQYLIPLAGMLLGNTLGGNIVVLQNLFNALEQRHAEYEAALSLGASPRYAVTLFVREAMQKALAPILASMATTGVVTLPGMMTGQILGGASPMVAIKYQMIIFIAIFVMMSISLMITLELTLLKTLASNGKIRVQALTTNTASK